ncbi:MAG: carboxylating nicotinate-nucleotide diphosphorylase [Candidatus Sericytochromatia bacterium]|nr:carboxylating nicotinate-nucleotide diphosphorylase [Candidatus Sericytochromatia bacterium]
MSYAPDDLRQTPDLWFEQHLNLDPGWVQARLTAFLAEDIPESDWSSLSCVAENTSAEARLLANQDLTFAGAELLSALNRAAPINCELLVKDGQQVQAGQTLAQLSGAARALLNWERVLLNLLQRLCGIATLTQRYTRLDLPPGFKILDTRKTTPGLRRFEKYAVAVGGGYNHRMDLSHVLMLKDNHLVAAGGLAAALTQARSTCPDKYLELEIDTLEQLDQALATGGFDALLLDNMSPETIREAVGRVRQHPDYGMRIFLEASGGITYDSLPAYAWTGVNGISVGALTTQAQNMDIKLEFTA